MRTLPALGLMAVGGILTLAGCKNNTLNNVNTDAAPVTQTASKTNTRANSETLKLLNLPNKCAQDDFTYGSCLQAKGDGLAADEAIEIMYKKGLADGKAGKKLSDEGIKNLGHSIYRAANAAKYTGILF